MTKEENYELLLRAKGGDKEAQDELIRGNMGLCKNLALRFLNRGVEYEDLIQIASIGLIKAVRSFDLSFGTAFSTYAVPLIIGEIRRFLRDDGSIKVGRSIKKLAYDAMKKKEAYVKEHGHEPKLSELSELCSVTVEELSLALDSASPIRSLSEPIGSGGDADGTSLEDFLCENEDNIGKITDIIALKEAINTLPKVQRQLIYLRYVKEMSQSNVGKILNMTQVKVSREEKKIIEYLRRAL